MIEPMKVRDLIAKLQEMPQDAEVYTDYAFDKNEDITVKISEACIDEGFECPAIVWLR